MESFTSTKLAEDASMKGSNCWMRPLKRCVNYALRVHIKLTPMPLFRNWRLPNSNASEKKLRIWQKPRQPKTEQSDKRKRAKGRERAQLKV